jgi:hypothetical protein
MVITPFTKQNGNSTEKAAMTFLMSLLLCSNVPWGNRTLNCPLGGGRYIHLTKETYSSAYRMLPIKHLIL